MPRYFITETRREIWVQTYGVTADSPEAALELYRTGDADICGEAEYIDTVTSDYEIEELPND